MTGSQAQLETEALKELLEVAVELKKTGVLGMLKEFLADSEGFMTSIQNDPSIFRLVSLVGAIVEAARKLDGAQIAGLKKNTENTVYCLFNSLSSTEPEKAEKVGMLGLMGALRDPDVQKGLGFIIALAKNLGGCLNRGAE